MKVVARPIEEERLPRGTYGNFLVSPGQIFLTSGNEYVVHGIKVYQGRVSFQIVSDLSKPEFYPVVLFDVVDTLLPSDWICNTLKDGQLLIIGPEFYAKDVASFEAMVLHDTDAMHLFWERLDWLFKREVYTFLESVQDKISSELYEGIQELMELDESAEALEIVCWELMENDSLDLASWEKSIELGKELELDEADTINWRFWKRLVKYGEKLR